LDDKIKAVVTVEEGYPALTRNFESSVPGLYFVGLRQPIRLGRCRDSRGRAIRGVANHFAFGPKRRGLEVGGTIRPADETI